MLAAAIWSIVVLPAPFGPSTAQRSSSSTVQSIASSSVLVPRRTVTWSNWITASGLTCAATPQSNQRARVSVGRPGREGDGAGVRWPRGSVHTTLTELPGS